MTANHPQLTYEQAVKHCRRYADIIRKDGIDLFVSDAGEAAVVADMLGYPLETQEWISREQHPLLVEIIEAARKADLFHTKREAWETLLTLINRL